MKLLRSREDRPRPPRCRPDEAWRDHCPYQ